MRNLGVYSCLRLRDVQHHSLHRRQPQRHRAGVVLDQDADEALHRADDRPVQHDRRFAAVVFGDDIRRRGAPAEEIDLHRAALPHAADAVLQRELDLGPVERALARLDIVCQSVLLERRCQSGLGLVPRLVRADALVRARGQLDQDLVEAEIAIDLAAAAR